MKTRRHVHDALDAAYENRSRLLDRCTHHIAVDLQCYYPELKHAKRRKIKKAIKNWFDLNEHLCI